ncbi:hypothetical protein [Aestuariivirga sp.]|uniref:hypothetical protein n=1 Tax=Aestuariivirga sp. TaxID=2650926 RepID=UPI0039E5ECAD
MKHELSRRALLSTLVSAPIGAFGGNKGGFSIEMVCQPSLGWTAEARPFAIAVTDGTVSREALYDQWEELDKEGVAAFGIEIKGCNTMVDVLQAAVQCDKLLAGYQANGSMNTAAMLSWCELSSPLRWLPTACNFIHRRVARLRGEPALHQIGCPDCEEEDEFEPGFEVLAGEGPTDEYWEWCGENTPAALAKRRFIKSLQRDGRSWAVFTFMVDSTCPLPAEVVVGAGKLQWTPRIV